MLMPSFSRLAVLGVALLCLLLFVSKTRFASPITRVDDRLVVHEWGTFTSVSNREGRPLIWRPLSFESDLPSFIYSIDKGESWRGLQYATKSGLAVRVRMETPVLYFYAKEEMTATVNVEFPRGKITEWYPHAQSVNQGIDWGEIRISPGLRVELPHDLKENHYYPARETDAATLAVPGERQTEYERFLFYRGVGNFGLPLQLQLKGDKVAITAQNVARAVLFENRGGRIGYRVVNLSDQEATFERPALDGDLGNLRKEIKSMLMAEGLYEKEADAMLNTWRDSWFEEGLRTFYVMPRKNTDDIIPIVINPRPASLVRVLVGRTELITPEMEQNVSTQVIRLADPSINVRQAALKEINRYGRFVEPILTQVLAGTTDPRVRTEATRLLGQMK